MVVSNLKYFSLSNFLNKVFLHQNAHRCTSRQELRGSGSLASSWAVTLVVMIGPLSHASHALILSHSMHILLSKMVVSYHSYFWLWVFLITNFSYFLSQHKKCSALHPARIGGVSCGRGSRRALSRNANAIPTRSWSILIRYNHVLSATTPLRSLDVTDGRGWVGND